MGAGRGAGRGTGMLVEVGAGDSSVGRAVGVLYPPPFLYLPNTDSATPAAILPPSQLRSL